MMKKKSVFLRSAVVLLVVAMVGATLFAGNTTLARYRASAIGTVSADVAAWSILVNDVDIALVSTFELDAEVLDWGYGFSAGGPDARVREGMIAPGTLFGLGEVEIENASDVWVDIIVSIELDGPTALLAHDCFDFDGEADLPVWSEAAGVWSATFTNVEPGETVDIEDDDFVWVWEFTPDEAAPNDNEGCEGCTAIGVAANAAVNAGATWRTTFETNHFNTWYAGVTDPSDGDIAAARLAATNAATAFLTQYALDNDGDTPYDDTPLALSAVITVTAIQVD